VLKNRKLQTFNDNKQKNDYTIKLFVASIRTF